MLVHYRGYVADSARWEGFTHRDGDIVISTPSKCGTTWMQMLVGLLVFGGQLPAPLSTLSPWVDMRIRSRAELAAQVEQGHRRFLKTHVPLDGVPLDRRVTYLVVGRDPRDAWLSMRDHRANTDSERVISLVGEDPPERGEVLAPEAAFVADVARPAGNDHTDVHPAAVLHHLRTGWDRRHDDNVALFHYADLAADLPGEIARLAAVLSIELTDELLEDCVAGAGFDAMRGTAGAAPESDRGIWKDPSRFFSRARLGEWRSTFSPDVLAAYADRAAALHADAGFLAWVHGGRHARGGWRGTTA